MTNRQAYKHASALCLGLALLVPACAEKKSITLDEAPTSEPRARALKYANPMPPVVSEYCKALIEGPGGDWDKLPSRPANLKHIPEFNQVPDELLSRTIHNSWPVIFFAPHIQKTVFNEWEKSIRNDPPVPLLHKYGNLNHCDGNTSYKISEKVILCSPECEMTASIENGKYSEVTVITASNTREKNTICYIKSMFLASGLRGAWSTQAKFEEYIRFTDFSWDFKRNTPLYECINMYSRKLPEYDSDK